MRIAKKRINQNEVHISMLRFQNNYDSIGSHSVLYFLSKLKLLIPYLKSSPTYLHWRLRPIIRNRFHSSICYADIWVIAYTPIQRERTSVTSSAYTPIQREHSVTSVSSSVSARCRCNSQGRPEGDACLSDSSLQSATTDRPAINDNSYI